MTGTRIWLVRHAEPTDAAGRCYGRSEMAVRRDATEQAAGTLAPLLPAGVPIVHSPRIRCSELARALRRLVPGPVALTDARIAEVDFGDWEGQPWDAIGAAALDRWAADFADARIGHRGETVREFMGRVAAARSASCAAGAGDVVWVSHAGVARALMLLEAGMACPRTAADWPREGIAFGALRVFGP